MAAADSESGGVDGCGKEEGNFFFFKKIDLGCQIIFDGPNLGNYRKGIFSLYILKKKLIHP